MADTSRMIKTKWFSVHGSPQILSGDPEFGKMTIRFLCVANEVYYTARSARRH